jgi:plasmid stability protein
MSTLVVKNLPSHLHEALKARARTNHRSLNKEATLIIEQALCDQEAHAFHRAPRGAIQPLSSQELENALQDERYRHLDTLSDVESLMDSLRAERDTPLL